MVAARFYLEHHPVFVLEHRNNTISEKQVPVGAGRGCDEVTDTVRVVRSESSVKLDDWLFTR